MQCQNCHRELAEGAKFCKFCGAKQEVIFSVAPNCEVQKKSFSLQEEDTRANTNTPLAATPNSFTTTTHIPKKSVDNALFEATPDQESPVKLKKAALKKKNRRWIPLVAGGVAVIVIIAVVLAILLKSTVIQLCAESGITKEQLSSSFLPEMKISDEASAEGPKEQALVPTPNGGNSAEKELPEETSVTFYCIACGENIPEDALFCPYCGKKQTDIGPEESGEKPKEITIHDENTIDTSQFFVLPIQSLDQSSVVIQPGTYDNTAYATIDGILETSWQEGAEGDGVGEWIRYNLGHTYTVQYLRLYLGNWRSSNLYGENNVPRALEIEANGQTWLLEFPYGQEPYVVEWSVPVETDYVALRVASVYEGSVYDDTCIAEVEIIGR